VRIHTKAHDEAVKSITELQGKLATALNAQEKMQDELRCSQKHLKEQLERQSADGAKNEDADAQRDRNFLLLTRENAQLRDLLGDADSKVGLILLAFHSRVCVLVSCNPPLPPPLPVSEMDVPEDPDPIELIAGSHSGGVYKKGARGGSGEECGPPRSSHKPQNKD